MVVAAMGYSSAISLLAVMCILLKLVVSILVLPILIFC